MNNKQQPTKTVHVLNSTYSESSWPTVSPQTEALILDLLLPLIEPIGQYRKNNISKSKGKDRNRKSKRKALSNSATIQPETKDNAGNPTVESPHIHQYLTLGFNSSVRLLELHAQISRVKNSREDEEALQNQVCAVLVCVSALPSIMTRSLPYLAAAASMSCEPQQAIKLVPISQVSASQIAQALEQPRAHVLGILKGIPGGGKLEQLIQNEIDPIEVPWIQESRSTSYRAVNISTEQVVVSKSQPKNRKRKRENAAAA